MSVLTPIRRGGPYGWGRDLVRCINGTGGYAASHLHRPRDVLSSPLRQDADLVHTSLPLSVRLWKQPLVLTVHGDYRRESRLWRPGYAMAVRRADAITTPSRFLRDRLGLDGAEVVPNAVFPERFGARERPGGDTIRLATVTKFYFRDKAEGVLDLLRLTERARRSFGGKLKLTVAGGGRFLPEVERKSTARDLDVRFTGFIDDPAGLLGSSDVFVYYSTHDNFPVALLEAMASGLPVLTSAVGAVREIVDDGRDGFVAETDGEYVERLERLLGDPQLRQAMGARARKKVEERFSWHTVAARYTAIYDRLSRN